MLVWNNSITIVRDSLSTDLITDCQSSVVAELSLTPGAEVVVRLSTDCCWTVGRHTPNSWPTGDQQGFLGELISTFTKVCKSLHQVISDHFCPLLMLFVSGVRCRADGR